VGRRLASLVVRLHPTSNQKISTSKCFSLHSHLLIILFQSYICYMYVGVALPPQLVTDVAIEIEKVNRLCQRCRGSHALYGEHMSLSWSQMLSPTFKDN
jgi:hypothetical protein